MGKALNMIRANKQAAMQLILLFGLVSLCGDIVYEGARSVNGQYLKTFGTNALIVGLVAGIGEFIGYGIRLVSGYFADKTRAYWIFTFIGYGLLAAVPLLALAGVWQVAALFMVLERLGKAVRAPARDTILSQAAKQVGTGFGFGLNEAMDQIGAVTGPLIFSAVFLVRGFGDYKTGFSILWIPFVLVIASVVISYLRVPDPEKLEKTAPVKKAPPPDRLTKVFWLYTVFTFLTAAGFVSFALLGFHFKSRGVLSDAQIPMFYAIAMGVDAAVALLIGKLYDRYGLKMLLVIPVLSLPIPFLAFTDSTVLAVVSVMLWGAAMGVHETIMKAGIADLTSLKKRGTGYGIFNTAYGVAMLAGGALVGLLYDPSAYWKVIAVAAGFQVLAVPALVLTLRSAES